MSSTSAPVSAVPATSFDATIAAFSTLLPTHLQRPRVAIVCGSGLSTLAGSLRGVVEVPYARVPGFSTSTVPGHRSALAFGLVGGEGQEGVPVVAMLGRFHPYEGHGLSAVTYPISVFARMGIKDIIITNAAGSLNPSIPVGTIVVIQDHLALPNLTGPLNPLLGPVLLPHARFTPLSAAYSPRLRRLAFLAAHSPSSPASYSSGLGLPREATAEGTYAWVSGPTYETPAEGRFLRAAGADVVGMSTVPEVVVARAEGMEVVVLSLVTNAVVIPEGYRSIKGEVEAEIKGRAGGEAEVTTMETKMAAEEVSHEEVLSVGKSKAEVMRALVERIVQMVGATS